MESTEVKLARLESKVDALATRIDDLITGLDKRMGERCASYLVRIEDLEKAGRDQGKRIGRLEAARDRAEGGLWASVKMLGAGGVLGGMIVKFLEWWR